jgi:hypothetical protein
MIYLYRLAQLPFLILLVLVFSIGDFVRGTVRLFKDIAKLFKRITLPRQKYTSYSYNLNVIILKKLGYYNLNITKSKNSFLTTLMNLLLFYDSSNYTKIDFPDYKLYENEMTILVNDFENLCIGMGMGKNKMDLSVNEIMNFIKKSDIYKKMNQDLYFKVNRAVVLSKYLNEKTTYNLLDALSIDEITLLTGK